MKEIKITIGLGDCNEDFIIKVAENLTEDEINDKVNEFYYDKVFEITGVVWKYK
jgi:hypothetical protein